VNAEQIGVPEQAFFAQFSEGALQFAVRPEERKGDQAQLMRQSSMNDRRSFPFCV
jgi:hypothetical protein